MFSAVIGKLIKGVNVLLIISQLQQFVTSYSLVLSLFTKIFKITVLIDSVSTPCGTAIVNNA